MKRCIFGLFVFVVACKSNTAGQNGGQGATPPPSATSASSAAPSNGSSTPPNAGATLASSAIPLNAAPSNGSAAPSNGSAAPSNGSAASPLLERLPKPASVPEGPVKIDGYPVSISSGMNDPARWVGFTTDGAEYGYCAELGGRDPQVTRCETVLRDGTTKLRTSEDARGYSASAMKALTAWRSASGLVALNLDVDRSKWFGKPVNGQWAFSDISIWVTLVPGDGEKTNALVKLGGAVGGEAPVYPVVLAKKPTVPGITYHSSFINDAPISTDGREIGAVGHFFCAEWCDEFVVYRNRTNAFAALVYNDTGFRHHKQGQYQRAAELFLAATWADPSAKHAPYNLACAWAKLGDPRAKDALAVALERDPTVKKRAPKDADFASVKDEEWFKAATQ
ncbi:MAG: hypothetical protein QM784_11740 [Polyangiaceae bacterium]